MVSVDWARRIALIHQHADEAAQAPIAAIDEIHGDKGEPGAEFLRLGLFSKAGLEQPPAQQLLPVLERLAHPAELGRDAECRHLAQQCGDRPDELELLLGGPVSIIDAGGQGRANVGDTVQKDRSRA
jgi:hypothetical protein